MPRTATARREGTPQDRARRRFQRRQWARRWLTWRYVVVGLLVVGLIGFGVYATYFSPWLRTEGVQVNGTGQLTEREVLTAAEVPVGGPLARVDLDAIATRVGSLATVESVDVTRAWPHDVRIDVVERTPVAVVDAGVGLRMVDAGGHIFGVVRALPDDLPLIVLRAGADDNAMAEGAAVVAALDTMISRLVDHVEVDSVDQIELELRDGRQVRWGSAEQSGKKAEVLLALLATKAKVYDVSVPGLPTVR
ncbi:FtsQ-type POTRA domain-containing protein [Nocardioides sp. GY 10113]|uniref:cell division protein FtsQ/DivIB n=1 Tax=Nocardioides sp. GY 10113 TaxID=2569761 RepID=UPI0010A7C03D|nr:FtsQ-type POTRA domain-containing protein [Nocardioides sp. GY 10113]TIC88638.1 FtsQ-type POTRA domain-containing protein [Nocardioides sp. GY 10113]